MGVVYDRKHGIRRVDWSCGAKIGDHVKSSGQSYEVVEMDEYGCYVCSNINPDCMVSDEVRTFDDADIDEVLKPDTSHGAGI